MISVFILPSNIIFRKIERKLSESEITPARKEREEEETDPETDSDEPRKPKTELVRRAMPKPIRQTQKTHSIAPSQTLIAPITPPTRSIAPSQTLIALITPPARSSHPSIDPPKIDRSRRTPKPIVLDPDSSSPTQLCRPHSSNPVTSLSLSQFDRI